MTCKHEDFIATVDVNRFQKSDDNPDVFAYNAEIKIKCSSCFEPMIFIGCPIGLLGNRPCIDPLGIELRAPLRPQSSDPHFGMGIPGFIARVAEGSEKTQN